MSSPILPMRNYVISRQAGADADEDPTGTLQFWPAKGSDELYEALKEAFPAYRTHKERMREAVLDFLLQERDQEAMQTLSRSMSDVGQPLPPALPAAGNDGHYDETADQAGQGSAAASFTTMPESAMPSPAFFTQRQQSQGSFHTTPEYLPSPESQFTGTFPSTPATTAVATEPSEQISAIPNSMSVPGLREMTTVWSVSSGSQPQRVRSRRAMTEAEKREYRRKRIDGACADCRRRRRKCDHESSESDSSSRCVAKKVRRAARSGAGAAASRTAPRPPAAAQQHFLERSSTGITPSLAGWNPSPQQHHQQQQSQQDALMGVPSSVLWHEDDLLDFSGMGMGTLPVDDLLDLPADPFEFVDFGQDGHLDDGQQSTFNDGVLSQHVWASSDPQQQQQQRVPGSGMIQPLPSYYADTEASPGPSSSGGTASLAASPTNMPSGLLHRLQTEREPDPHREPGELQQLQQRERSVAVGRLEAVEEHATLRPSDDGRPIPPRVRGKATDGSSSGADYRGASSTGELTSPRRADMTRALIPLSVPGRALAAVVHELRSNAPLHDASASALTDQLLQPWLRTRQQAVVKDVGSVPGLSLQALIQCKPRSQVSPDNVTLSWFKDDDGGVSFTHFITVVAAVVLLGSSMCGSAASALNNFTVASLLVAFARACWSAPQGDATKCGRSLRADAVGFCEDGPLSVASARTAMW